MRIPRALTIAGSDSGGGAGIQADLKTFTVLGVYGMSALTALTAQNTVTVSGIHEVPPEFVAQQIDTIVEDIGVNAVKTGMLSSAPIVEAVADRLKAHHLHTLVVDPVMISKSGAALLRPEAVHALKTVLLPRAHVVTPNLHEASALVGREIRDRESMKDAAKRIQDMGPRYVVIKGGHLDDDPVDLLYTVHDFIEFRGERHETKDTHGTGCIFAAAITAQLAKGSPVPEAVGCAKDFVSKAIRNGLRIGHGHGPADPLANRPGLAE